MPEIRDGKSIDKLPESYQDQMYGRWVYAHNAVGIVCLDCSEPSMFKLLCTNDIVDK